MALGRKEEKTRRKGKAEKGINGKVGGRVRTCSLREGRKEGREDGREDGRKEEGGIKKIEGMRVRVYSVNNGCRKGREGKDHNQE
jgi:hypothetical protein